MPAPSRSPIASAGCRRSAACSALTTRHRRPRSTPLSLDALKLLKAYRRFDVEAIAALRVPAAVETEVESVMRRYTRFVLEREARSLAFIDEVRHSR